MARRPWSLDIYTKRRRILGQIYLQTSQTRLNNKTMWDSFNYSIFYCCLRPTCNGRFWIVRVLARVIVTLCGPPIMLEPVSAVIRASVVRASAARLYFGRPSMCAFVSAPVGPDVCRLWRVFRSCCVCPLCRAVRVSVVPCVSRPCCHR